MKMCPFCGNQVDDNVVNCPYCDNRLPLNDKQKNSIYTNKILKYTAICVIFVIIIFTPALIIMSYAFPLVSGVNKVDNKKICNKECGLFSYEYTSDEDYCICDNGDTYNTISGNYMFNMETALKDKVASYREKNLDKFETDLSNKRQMMVIIQGEDNLNYIEQINSLIHFFENNNLEDVRFHYIELDRLDDNDVTRLNELFDVDFKSDPYVVLIDNGEPIYVASTYFYFDSSDLRGLLYQYFSLSLE